MFDKVSPAVTPPASMKIGDLRFIPGQGICVYSGNEEFEYGGAKEIYYLFAPINDLNAKIRKPSSKWDDNEFPAIADFDEIKQVFDVLTGRAKEKRGVWSRLEKMYNSKLLQPDLTQVAEVVHYIMSKKRRNAVKSDEGKLYDTAPADLSLSYSVRMILNDALDVLTPVLEFRCGLEKNVARDMLIRATVDKGYKEHKSLKDVAGEQAGLSSREFQGIFGERRRAAAKVVDGGTIEYMPPSNDTKPQRPTQADYDYADALDEAVEKRAAEIQEKKVAKTKKKRKRKAPSKNKSSTAKPRKRTQRKKASSGRRDARRVLPVLPHNEEMYTQLKSELPTGANVLAVFNLAAGVLDHPEDLKIASKLWLVRREHRTDHSDMREQLGLRVDQYLARIQQIKKKLEQTAKEKNLRSISRISLKFPNESRRKRTGSDSTKKAVISPQMQEAQDFFQRQSSSDPSHKSVFNLATRTFRYPAELATATSLWLASPEHKMPHEQVRAKLGLSESKYNKFVKDIFSKLKDAATKENLRAFTKIKFDFSDAQRDAGHSMTYSIDETQLPVSDPSLAKGPG